MQDQQSFHANVLKNMADGVMALDMKGTVTMFNPAAGRILGLNHEDVAGQAFGAVFMTLPVDNDEFVQLILDAVYKHASGVTERATFNRPDGGEAELSVTCSYIRNEDGGNEPGGVVVVMSDITELARLQAEEQKLRSEIQETCVRLEDTNQTLSQTMRRMRIMRWAAIGVVACIMLGAGGWAWQSGGLESLAGASPDRHQSAGEVQLLFNPVAPQPISSSISLSGKLEPIETVTVISPFAGRVLKKHFAFGQRVKKGDLLFTLDTTELMTQLREARASYIKAKERFSEVSNWEQSTEVSRAKRSYQRSRSQLENLKNKLEDAKALFKKGIVPRNELDSAQESFNSQIMDARTAEEELDSVMAKGDEQNRIIARMEYENARTKYEELQRRVGMAEVRAPVEGVAIQPPTSSASGGLGGSSGKKAVEVGVSVQEGDIMVAVANLEGLSVQTEVDEVDISKISLGQKVRVTGDAFPGVVLRGKVESISSQAKASMSIPQFDVRVAIDELGPEEMQRVRLGMSATLEVTVYDNPKALLVPISAVKTGPQGKYVIVQGAGGQPEDRPVRTGMTTMTSVEILDGLKPGDMVAGAGGGFSGMAPGAAQGMDAPNFSDGPSSAGGDSMDVVPMPGGGRQ